MAVLALAGAPPAVGQGQLQAIQADLAAKGPAAVLKTWFACDGGKGYGLVEAGDGAAIALAARLIPSADACFGEGLGSALGVAMARNAPAVLALVDKGPGFSAAQICLPFLSAEDPPAKNAAIVARTRAAIAKVGAPELQAQKKACLAVIAATPSS